MNWIITLIDEEHAGEGYEFVYYGEAEECGDCKLYGVCIGNLEGGRRYRIVETRPLVHSCKIYGGAKVVAVEVARTEAAVPKRKAIGGASLNFYPQECGDVLCENYSKCRPEGVFAGEKVNVEEVKEKVECPLGRELALVVLKPA